jgi:hypothetical protein
MQLTTWQCAPKNLATCTWQCTMTHSQVPGWTHLRVQLCRVAESWDLEGALDFQHYRGVEGRARSPRIRLGRRTRRSNLNLHLKQTTKWLVHIWEHLWVLGQDTGTLTHKTHHGPDSRKPPPSPIYYSLQRSAGATSKWLFFPGLPSWSPEIVPKLSRFKSRDFESS